MRLTLRFDMRRPGNDPELASSYAAMIDMCVWADSLGFEEVFVGEHHGAEDSYIPSPIVLLSAVATDPAHADRYCLQGPIWGYPGNCQFSTYHQCMATASGTHASCGINPRYAHHHRGQSR